MYFCYFCFGILDHILSLLTYWCWSHTFVKLSNIADSAGRVAGKPTDLVAQQNKHMQLRRTNSRYCGLLRVQRSQSDCYRWGRTGWTWHKSISRLKLSHRAKDLLKHHAESLSRSNLSKNNIEEVDPNALMHVDSALSITTNLVQKHSPHPLLHASHISTKPVCSKILGPLKLFRLRLRHLINCRADTLSDWLCCERAYRKNEKCREHGKPFQGYQGCVRLRAYGRMTGVLYVALVDSCGAWDRMMSNDSTAQQSYKGWLIRFTCCFWTLEGTHNITGRHKDHWRQDDQNDSIDNDSHA